MADETLSQVDGAAKSLGKKAAIDLVCEAVDIYAKKYGEPQAAADIRLFKIAEVVTMKKNGRAASFLEHFLYGDGSPIEFDLALLLRESAAVRTLISKTITSRLQANPELVNRTMSGGPFEFPIHQWDYHLADHDWEYALGTFFIEWEVDASKSPQSSSSPQSSRPGGTVAKTGMLPPTSFSIPSLPEHAKIYGAKEYHWHDKTQRVTECLHQAGYRLAAAGVAKNFWMIAKPCVIQISTGWPVDKSGSAKGATLPTSRRSARITF
jgi:hypothetical protein